MKLFLVNFSTPLYIDLALSLKTKGMDIVYWLGGKSDFDNFFKKTTDFPNTIFHSYFEALNAKPAPTMDLTNFQPVGQEIIDKLSKYELQTLSMMSKLDYDQMSLESKRHLYYQQVEYWYNVLVILKPDVLIFSDIPHTVFNFVLYNIAKILGIRTIITRRMQGLLGRMLIFDDYQTYEELKTVYQRLQNENFQFKDLTLDLQEYYSSQTQTGASLTKFFQRFMVKKAKDLEVLPRFSSIIKNIKNFTFTKTSLSYLKMLFNKKRYVLLGDKYYYGLVAKKMNFKANRLKRNFKKEYLSLQSQPDFSKKFIYLPLHFQPEAQTNPMGGVFDDQILMINILSAALPKEWVIYIKEHSIQWEGPRAQFGRYTGYYHEIARLNNVYLIPVETPVNELIEKSQAIATVTGTTGWEALMKLKPVLLFGYIWYSHCSGVFRVYDLDSCIRALCAVAKGQRPNKEDIIQFLGAIDQTSLRAYSKTKYKDELNISYSDNLNNISEVLYYKLIGRVK